MTKYLKIFGIIGTLSIILFYAFFQGRNLIYGPILEIHSPENGISFTEPLIEITGIAKNISFIYLNENQIFVDSAGEFKEQLLLLPGYNIITLRVTDKFDREVKRELYLTLQN